MRTAIAMLEENARIEGGAPRLLADPKRGFRHFGEFAQAVVQHTRGGRRPMGVYHDKRLEVIATAPTTVGNEATGADSGFAVPPAFSSEIWVQLLAADSFVPLCDGQKTSTNSMVFPADQSPPWTTGQGIVATWQSEQQGLLTQVKPLLSGEAMRLSKVLAFVPLTQELMDDSIALSTYLPKKCGDALSWRLNDAILTGNGNGQPLGYFNSKCAVVQAKDSGQATLTMTVTNASNMLTRLPPGSHGRAVYLCNISALAALFSIGSSASGNPIVAAPFRYVPGTRLPCSGLLNGIPIVPTGHGGLFSSQGDLSLVDFSWYRLLTRPEEVDEAYSMHVYFDAAAGAFRCVLRVDGHPLARAPISPPAGSTTYSPCIVLAAR